MLLRRSRNCGRQEKCVIAPACSGLEALESRRLLDAVDDRYEDNDTAGAANRAVQAAPNSPNLGPIQGTKQIKQLKLVDASDYYKIRLTTTGTSADFAKINFNRANGDLDVRLYGANGKRLLRSSQGTTGVEQVSLQGLAAGAYYFRVYGKNGATNPIYRLTINGPTPVTQQPGDDAYEDNDTIEQVAARQPGPQSPNLGQITTQTISNLKLADGYDIFRFTVTSTLGPTAFVHITSADPLDMVLFNSAGQPVRSAEAYQGQYTISFDNLIPDSYSLQITHYALNTPGTFNYSLAFQV